GMARHLARVDRGVPARRIRCSGPHAARPRAPLCTRERDRAFPLSAGVLHGDLRLRRLRRRTGARGVDGRAGRGRERPLPFLSRAPRVITLPLWVVIVVGALAAWALYEHVLLPALGWLVTHPANQVIDDVSSRLRIGIRPFQRTRRQALIHRLLTDPKVQQAADERAD